MQFSRKNFVLFIIGIGVFAFILVGLPTTSFIDSALAQTGVYNTDAASQTRVVSNGNGCIFFDTSVNPPHLVGALTNLTLVPSILGFDPSGRLVRVDGHSAAVVNGEVITTFELTFPIADKVEVYLNNTTGRCTIVDVPTF